MVRVRTVIRQVFVCLVFVIKRVRFGEGACKATLCCGQRFKVLSTRGVCVFSICTSLW